ncbi:hypothetical protein [Mycobacterium sp. GA-2829]|uniref:hypothetical protein n=1 Tax=Mycobacterium sp. GA-2829 TaxID=1772283 RepID=UPI001E60F275|nr:hypothetical protein [Mycobacterium sp. GA-2829]
MAYTMHSSNSDAADTFWERYSGPDNMAFNRNIPAYGMTNLQAQQRFSETHPHLAFPMIDEWRSRLRDELHTHQIAAGAERGDCRGDSAPRFEPTMGRVGRG